MYLLWRYIKNPTTAEAIATPRGTPKPMPTLEEEVRADDTAADSEARLFEEAAAVELAEAELADLLRVPLIVELPGMGLVMYKAGVVVSISPVADAAEFECCIAALAIELAFCVAELAAARAAAVG